MNNRVARTGHGRWAITPTHPGYLWCSDAGAIGFEPVIADGVDPAPVLAMLEAFADKPADEAFDLIAGLISAHTITGNLDTWTPDAPTRPTLVEPMSVDEIQTIIDRGRR